MVYMVQLCHRAVYLMYLRLFHSPTKARPCRRKRHHRRRIVLATANKTLRGHTTITFDTDGIPFIVNNSETCIITNERSLFVGNLMLVNDSNVAHIYDIPGAIYDPSLQFNLLGIPNLADFFQDKGYLQGDDVDSD